MKLLSNRHTEPNRRHNQSKCNEVQKDRLTERKTHKNIPLGDTWQEVGGSRH